MFNLEAAFAEWKRQMQSAGVKNPEILEELESHLREDVAQRVLLGESEQQAFEAAAQYVGQAAMLHDEFEKLGKMKWLRTLKGILIRVFAPVPNVDTFTPCAQHALELARLEAPRLKHGFVGTEHVLLGLLALDEGIVSNVLRRLDVDRQGLKKRIENFVSAFPTSPISSQLPYTPRVEKSLRLAGAEARNSNQTCVGAEHLLIGLLLERDGVAGRVLREFGVNPKATRDVIQKESSRVGE